MGGAQWGTQVLIRAALGTVWDILSTKPSSFAPAITTGRLQGTLLGVSSTPCLPLSCQGQARHLIEKASNKENLGQMYIWWMAWF